MDTSLTKDGSRNSMRQYARVRIKHAQAIKHSSYEKNQRQLTEELNKNASDSLPEEDDHDYGYENSIPKNPRKKVRLSEVPIIIDDSMITYRDVTTKEWPPQNKQEKEESTERTSPDERFPEHSGLSGREDGKGAKRNYQHELWPVTIKDVSQNTKILFRDPETQLETIVIIGGPVESGHRSWRRSTTRDQIAQTVYHNHDYTSLLGGSTGDIVIRLRKEDLIGSTNHACKCINKDLLKQPANPQEKLIYTAEVPAEKSLYPTKLLPLDFNRQMPRKPFREIWDSPLKSPSKLSNFRINNTDSCNVCRVLGRHPLQQNLHSSQQENHINRMINKKICTSSGLSSESTKNSLLMDLNEITEDTDENILRRNFIVQSSNKRKLKFKKRSNESVYSNPRNITNRIKTKQINSFTQISSESIKNRSIISAESSGVKGNHDKESDNKDKTPKENEKECLSSKTLLKEKPMTKENLPSPTNIGATNSTRKDDIKEDNMSHLLASEINSKIPETNSTSISEECHSIPSGMIYYYSSDLSNSVLNNSSHNDDHKEEKKKPNSVWKKWFKPFIRNSKRYKKNVAVQTSKYKKKH